MRRFGIDQSVVMAAGQAQGVEAPGEAFAPLPAAPGPAPYRLALSKVLPGLTDSNRVFHVMGDTGGVKDPNPQAHVATAQAADAVANSVQFAYHVGDVDYFTGEQAEYGPQFFEAYEKLNVPIFAIPGNHDGAGDDQLASFMRYFCDQQGPRLLPEIAEFNRDTLEQPNCYWTLQDDLVTIIGLYSNVPSGGVIETNQEEWLIGELKAAPKGVALIVALHHPPYSCDAHHGGSAKMGEILDQSITAAGRCPDLVLSGHVHNMQRINRTYWERQIPYIVCGAGGYHNLHAMASDAKPGLEVAKGVVLEAFDATQWGFLRLTVNASHIAGEYVGVDKEGNVTPGVDSFTTPVGT